LGKKTRKAGGKKATSRERGGQRTIRGRKQGREKEPRGRPRKGNRMMN